MISQELINSRLQVILLRLGKKVTNTALFREELGADCPSDEEILAEDAKYLEEESAKQQAIEASKQKEAQYSAWVAQGFDTGLGFKLAVGKDDQTAFANLIVGIDFLKLPNDYTLNSIIGDINGNRYDLTVGQLKQMMSGYIIHCIQGRSQT